MSGRYFLYIVIATFITILIWFGMEIAHTRSKSQVAPDVAPLLEPVNPNFDPNVINDL